ncbi:hypothetical protein M2308_001244 [Rhizobium leguminosarum]|nr:hypothetical protein [Rhizobium leguminosarum]
MSTPRREKRDQWKQIPEDETMKILVLTLGVILLPLAAAAAEADAGRFQLEKSGDHFVRLDRQTGAMSICQDKDGALVCRMAADERAAYEDELDRLSERVTKLEQGGVIQRALPSDAEVERSISIMERMMKSFMGMVKEFRAEENTNPLPQKT